jgi:hypothetical protein
MGQREELLRLMRLSQEDLEANRAGVLSQRQARSIVQSGLRNLLGALLIGLALATLLYAVASKPLAPIQWLLAAALAAAVLTVGYLDYRRTRLAAAERRVECLRSSVRVYRRGRAGWYLTIAGRAFKLPMHFWQVHNDAPYRVYVAPKAKRIVCLEPDGWNQHKLDP